MARQGWDSPRLRWHVEYGCRDDYGTTLETTSAWAGLHYFASRDPEGLIFTWPEGNGWLVRHLLSRIGERVTTGALAFRVAASPRGVEVDYVDIARGEAVRVEASRAVVCLPSFLRPRVVEVSMAAFLHQPPALQRQLLRQAIQQIKGDVRALEFRHWMEIQRLFTERPVGTLLDLPGGVQLRRERDRVLCRMATPCVEEKSHGILRTHIVVPSIAESALES